MVHVLNLTRKCPFNNNCINLLDFKCFTFREDYLSSFLMNDVNRQEFYMNIKSGAESGWDFSSRWFIAEQGGHNEGNLSHIRTRDILPVDLNAFMCMNARLLSNMFRRLGNHTKADAYHEKFIQWKEAIKQVGNSDLILFTKILC